MPTTTAMRPAYPWVPDLGDGTFQNPVLFADYSDPDVIRDGEDFYLVASSFNCTPGLPILHSRDLVNWTVVNHAVKNLPDPRGVFHTARHGEGIWAPAIRKHDGRFWIVFPMPDEGIYVVTADDPRGRWSEPHLIVGGKGLIDPCPLWDDDGRAYLAHAYAHSRSGQKHKLRVCPMAPDASKLLGDGKIIYENPGVHPTIEGPKFLKRDGYYYILAPAGGVESGWQVALRSREVYGPYEARIVLERGSTAINGPHQGALVELESGESWFVHFQDVKPTGRVVHLQPAAWLDGWPTMGVDYDGNGVGEPVTLARKPRVPHAANNLSTPRTSDKFDCDRLGLQWQWHGNHRDEWCSLSARPGWLRLFPQFLEAGGFSNHAALLLQKFPAASFVVETLLDIGPVGSAELSGLIIMGRHHAGIGVRRSMDGAMFELIYFERNGAEQRERCIASVDPGTVALRVTVHHDAKCTFSFLGENGVWSEAKGGGCFLAKEGVWIGAKIGLFSVTSTAAANQPRGHVDFEYFRFSAPFALNRQTASK
jgi:beta-xylosidase